MSQNGNGTMNLRHLEKEIGTINLRRPEYLTQSLFAFLGGLSTFESTFRALKAKWRSLIWGDWVLSFSQWLVFALIWFTSLVSFWTNEILAEHMSENKSTRIWWYETRGTYIWIIPTQYPLRLIEQTWWFFILNLDPSYVVVFELCYSSNWWKGFFCSNSVLFMSKSWFGIASKILLWYLIIWEILM